MGFAGTKRRRKVEPELGIKRKRPDVKHNTKVFGTEKSNGRNASQRFASAKSGKTWPRRSLSDLAPELIQEIFIQSRNFDLPLCSKALYETLSSPWLQTEMIREHSVADRNSLSTDVSVCNRRFVTKVMLEELNVQSFWGPSHKEAESKRYSAAHVETVMEGNEAVETETNSGHGAGPDSTATNGTASSATGTIDATPANADAANGRSTATHAETDVGVTDATDVATVPVPVPLPWALQEPPLSERKLALLGYLLKRNCYVTGFKLVQYAVKTGSEDLLDMLLLKGAKFDYKSLVVAFEAGNQRIAQKLLDSRVLSPQDDHLWDYVSNSKNLQLFHFLRSLGASPPYDMLM